MDGEGGGGLQSKTMYYNTLEVGRVVWNILYIQQSSLQPQQPILH